MNNDDMVERLRGAIDKLTKWTGIEVADLIDEDYLKEGDMW